LKTEFEPETGNLKPETRIMSARVEKTVPAKRLRTEQVIINFDAERLKAPFLLRCGAILIDYILIVSIPIISLLLSRLMNVSDSRFLNNEFTNVGWLIMILLTLTNLIIFPFFSSQSIGKMLTGLRIVNKDGNAPSIKQLFIRHFVGYPLSILSFGLGLLLAVFNRNGRALHDFLTGTMVIYGKRQLK
jgi:uncharacterized RDD family membrane protein YckC